MTKPTKKMFSKLYLPHFLGRYCANSPSDDCSRCSSINKNFIKNWLVALDTNAISDCGIHVA